MPTPREVSVALLKTSRLADVSPVYSQWLDAKERARAQSFSRERDAREYIAAHGLLRAWLSRIARDHGAAVEPSRWRFAAGAHGKPHLVHRHHGPDLRFSLSHGDGLVAVAVTVGHEVGVDVEREARQITDPLRLAQARFSPAEIAELGAIDDLTARRRRFMALWTRMEALAKGTGLGLAMRRDSREIPLAGSGATSPARTGNERRIEWRFSHWRVAEHLVTLAAARRAGERLLTPCRVVRWSRGDASFEEAPSARLQPRPA